MPTLEFELNSDGTATMTDILGKRAIPTEHCEIIKDQLKVLEAYRDDGRKPSKELLGDIACYKFILDSMEPQEQAAKYFEWRNKTNGRPWQYLNKVGDTQ